MNERDFGRQVKTVLDQAPVSARVEARLAAARQRAVARAAEIQRRPVLVTRLAGASHWFSEKWHAHPAAWSTGVAFALLLAFSAAWQVQVHSVEAERTAVDVQMLADEVPLDTFIDTRFEQWSNTTATERD
ncbi:DUF3619 family protein [Silvimonas iriomotensis]|uniref:DUF3619 family protein n=1 Tax=Silvimonas iriomotensis TaxID=449662 RepID=A0ABQ2PB69_9NEIS|nr:DUF3619 family protein [Silvimonas iriomotensis]GGP22150.1 hypothetical protein GCM10010970_23800 [Silvimonas iriomotensis]